MSHLSHENERRKRRVEPDNAGAGIADEDKARGLLESLLWPNGTVCPHCKNHKEKPIYNTHAESWKQKRSPQGRLYLWRVPEAIHRDRRNDFRRFTRHKSANGSWLFSSFARPRNPSAQTSFSRMLKFTYKAAWFMSHRLRFAVSPEMPLSKAVERAPWKWTRHSLAARVSFARAIIVKHQWLP